MKLHCNMNTWHIVCGHNLKCSYIVFPDIHGQLHQMYEQIPRWFLFIYFNSLHITVNFKDKMIFFSILYKVRMRLELRMHTSCWRERDGIGKRLTSCQWKIEQNQNHFTFALISRRKIDYDSSFWYLCWTHAL